MSICKKLFVVIVVIAAGISQSMHAQRRSNNLCRYLTDTVQGYLHLLMKTDYPLHHCARIGDHKTLRVFIQDLEDSSDVDMQDAAGWTALHYAVRYKHPSCVAVLIASYANVNRLTFDNRRPINFVQEGDLTSLEMLIKAGSKYY